MVSSLKVLSLRAARFGLLARLFFFVCGSVLLGYLVSLQVRADEVSYEGSGLLIFTIVNLNIAVLCILIFLVARNIVKLVFDRRRGILGSKLRTRLLIAFVGITLVPTTILFLQASGLLSRAMEGWFSSQIEMAVDGAVEIGRRYYQRIEGDVDASSQSIHSQYQQEQLGFEREENLARFLDTQRARHQLFALGLYTAQHEPLASSTAAIEGVGSFELPPLQRRAVDRALSGERSVQFERRETAQFIRSYLPIIYRSQPAVLVATHRISPELVELFTQVTDSFKEYEQLKVLKHQLQSAFLLTLAMITGLILFAAIWFAFYLSRELSTPVQQLAEGIERVARGKYDFQLRAAGDDELGTLVAGFNLMTKDLKRSREQLELRQSFIEKVLGSLSSAVIVLETDGTITLVNARASQFGKVGGPERYVGRSLPNSFPDALVSTMSQVLKKSTELSSGEYEQDVMIDGRPRKLQIHFARIDPVAETERAIILFVIDDITELSEAQRMSVWREAAKRIAHEIKNPLTPIQLSTQRLEKMISGLPGLDKASGALKTILDNVRSIQRLASEFSNFARMPVTRAESFQFFPMIQSVVAMFAEDHPDIQFRLLSDSEPCNVRGDSEQLRRVFVNLLANAAAVLQEQTDPEDTPKIQVRVSVDPDSDQLLIEVSDNGPGVPDELKRRVFDPYFTTRKSGTGLGLAIVGSIIQDHGGTIEVQDNSPQGAMFIVHLPLRD